MMGHGYTGGLTFQEQAAELMEERRKRHYYWAMLRQANDDFKKIVSPKKYGSNVYAFSYYLQDIYGLRPELDGSGNYTGDYTILDEKKYLLFLLKYGTQSVK